MAETRNGRSADPLTDAAATEALVAALDAYLPPTTERKQREERLRTLVTLLASKGCSNAEVVRILSKRGVRTSWRTVKRLRPRGGSPPSLDLEPGPRAPGSTSPGKLGTGKL